MKKLRSLQKLPKEVNRIEIALSCTSCGADSCNNN